MQRTDTDYTIIKSFLPDYLRQKGLHTGRNFSCLNPEHADKTPSMSYYKNAQKVHCFGCGASYDIFDLVGMDYKLESFSEKIEKICQLFGIQQQFNNPTAYEEATPKKLKVKNNTDQDNRNIQLEKIRENSSDCQYLLKRGITEESCKKYQFFKKADREYMPIFLKDQCSGWVGRATSETVNPRYKNSSGGLGIWNGDYLLNNDICGNIFVTEGIIDAVLIEQTGRRAIALCGASNTNKLINILTADIKRTSKLKFIICGDNDKAGETLNKRLSQELKNLSINCDKIAIPEKFSDIGEIYLQDRAKLEEILIASDERDNQDSSVYELLSASSMLDGFLQTLENQPTTGISTGFKKLDKLLDGGLYQGLYIIGAVSSLGKTSFILQLADFIADSSQDVIFYSLEQSRNELMAKSISRISLMAKLPKPFTQREVLRGIAQKDKDFSRVVNCYKNVGDCLFIKEGIASIGADEIRADVRKHIEARKKKPVVIVDYLQILKPKNQRATDKQNTDISVVELKRISRDFDLPVIAISSFNRENYKNAVSMEAFKESGAVEYSSDVLIGLQLKGAGGRNFDVNLAKEKDPREVELVMLKNRSGIPYGKVEYSYYSKYNLFKE